MQRKNKNPPRVSVLIANYNGERFLAAAIESVLSQSFTDFELIVVDDGSTDQSVSLLDAYANKDKRLRVFCFPQNRGFAQALNYGLSVSRGEYVARMDSDDLCHRDRLLKQISYLDKHAEIHVLGCRYRAIDEKGAFCSAAAARRLRRQPITLARGRHRVAKRVLLGPYPVLHPTIVCRRSTLLSIGGYRDFFPIAEDDDLYSRIVSMHGRVLDNLPKKLYYYRHYGGSMSQRFDRSLHLLILRIIGLSSEFRRRGFWDPLDERPSATCRGLRFKGVSSLLFLQDSLVFLPYSPREGLYYWLRVVVILRRFGLKDFRQVSFWREWGMTMSKQIYFYTYFGLKCFYLEKFRTSFLYFRYIFSLYSRVSPFTALFSFLIIIFSSFFLFIRLKLITLKHQLITLKYQLIAFIEYQLIPFIKYQLIAFIKYQLIAFVMFTDRRSNNRLFLSRSLIFTSNWRYGVKHLLIAFCYNPFFVTKFFIIRFFAHFWRIMHVLFHKLRF